MIRAFRTFWAFSKRSYKVCAFILAPAVYLTIHIFLLETGLDMATIGIINLSIVIMLETMLDFVLLGGFYSKNNSALEYLQSSSRFLQIITDVVWTDMLRKLLVYVGGYLLLGFFISSEEFAAGLPIAVVTLFCIYVVCFIERHFSYWYNAYCAAMIADCIIYMIILPLMLMSSGSQGDMFTTVIETAVGLALTVCAMIGTDRYSKEKVRDSYYD